MTPPAQAARRRILDEHAPVLEALETHADAVAETWDDDVVDDRALVVTPFRASLEAAGVTAHLASVLVDAVSATGQTLSARPVPAPPYVIVTSRGPVLRATIDPGRLVIALEVFEVVREPETGYRRRDGLNLTISLE